MTDGAVVARSEPVNVARRDGAEGFRCQCRCNASLIQQFAAVEAWQANEFAARIEAAVGGQREEGTAAAAGRNEAEGCLQRAETGFD